VSMKNPLTQPGIEPATFRFVAQHLNHCATAVPLEIINTYKIISFVLQERNYNLSINGSTILKLSSDEKGVKVQTFTPFKGRR